MMKIATVAIVSCVLCSCKEVNKELGVEDDNAAEQFIEKEIKQQTGIDVDLSPEEANGRV